jgi:desulfoferrodoxin-like iron-binding protein
MMVNVQNAGETYRCRVCGNVVIVREAGGGELVCHGEPMQLVEGQENAKG